MSTLHFINNNVYFQGKIEACDSENLKDLCFRMVDRQPSLIFDILAEQMAANQPPKPPADPSEDNPAPEWCKCRNCRDMPTLEENLCCGYRAEDCISVHPVNNRLS